MPTDRDCHEVNVGLFLGHLQPLLIAVGLYKREGWTVFGFHHSCPHRPCHLLLPLCVKKQFVDRGLCPQSFSMRVVPSRMLVPAIVVLISVCLWHEKVPFLVLTVTLWYPMLCHTRTASPAYRQKLQEDIIISASLHPGYTWIQLIFLCFYHLSRSAAMYW